MAAADEDELAAMQELAGAAQEPMEAYRVMFWAALVCTVALACVTQRDLVRGCLGGGKRGAFRALQLKYLIVYAFMVSGDWLQGPYVYALYEKYGFEREMIAFLFVAGFGSSMLAGTFVGSLADRLGRKKLGILYAVLYIGSCLTKHSSQVYWLLLGRVLGGVATSLLMSVFETWLVCEHNRLGLDQRLLSDTLSLGVLINSLVAITSGVLAQSAASALPFERLGNNSTWWWGGYTTPFDMAIGVLLVGIVLITLTWRENFGESTSTSNSAQFMDALEIVRSNKLILAVGLVQSCFEGAMYSFVFMWTPALASDPPPPYGTIFATFMICCMLGSQLFGLIVARDNWTCESIMVVVFGVAAVSLALGPLGHLLGVEGTGPQYAGFLLFEICVGVYFPGMGTVKSRIVPEAYRSAIYNIFRVPLNIIVLVVLLGNFSVDFTFCLCTALLVLALALQLYVCGAAGSPASHVPLPQ